VLVAHAQSSREAGEEENTEFNVVREATTKKHARRNMQYGVACSRQQRRNMHEETCNTALLVRKQALLVRVAARFCKPYICHAKGEQKPIAGDFELEANVCNRRAVYSHISIDVQYTLTYAMWWSNNGKLCCREGC
jgi:hypothetical protein